MTGRAPKPISTGRWASRRLNERPLKPLDPDRWHEIDAVLSAALDLPPDERVSFVRERTAGDVELARTVEELLLAGDEATSFLELPVALDSRTWLEAAEEFFERQGSNAVDERSYVGRTLGVWRIERELGRGGMARVFLAERSSGGFDQRAALKLLRSDLDANVVERFRAERQILSNLSHPNIARLLDGGSTGDGQPYLVMEAVEGRPITEWCDRRRLNVSERLELFRDVLGAVQYAHANLVVHRDLKPSNIFVTEEGRVKLLDFGIAQLLGGDGHEGDDGHGNEERARLLLTPEYASPEQVTGRPITTASDVYQLGLLLYRLLSGTRPYTVTGKSRDALFDAVLRAEVVPPSRAAAEVDAAVAEARRTRPERLARGLSGDLDAIVMKAIRKDPTGRHASVAELDADLADHLANRPVAAAGGGNWYRIRKFFGRNRWTLPALAATCLAAAAYVGVQNTHEKQLERERNHARTEAARTDVVKGFLVEVFRSADPWSSPDPARGRNITVREALATGADRARSELARQPEIQVDLLAAIAGVYENLGLHDQALPLLEEGLEIKRRSDPSDRVALTALKLQLGRTLSRVDQLDSARAVLTEASTFAADLEAPHDTAVGTVLGALAVNAVRRGRLAEAATLYLHADSVLRQVPAAKPMQRSRILRGLSDVYPQLNRLADARATAEDVVRLNTEAFGADDPRTAVVLVQLADILDLSDRDEEAIGLYRAAIVILERALGEEHDATLSALNNLGVTLYEVGRVEEEEEILRRVLAIRTEQTGVWNRDVAEGMQNLAANLRRQGKDAEAMNLLTRAHRVFVTVLPDGHHLTAFPLLTRSAMELDRHDFMAAEATTREARRILAEALPPGHFATAMAECRLGRALAGQDRYTEAESLLRESTEIVAEALQLPAAYRVECLEGLAELLEATGRPADAQPYRTATRELTDAS